MGDKTTSTTKEIPGNLVDKVLGFKTYETTIRDGETGKTSSGLGNTPEDSQEVASEKYSRGR